jgi:pimeloyl-ACP methyl ester carboxylesterase
MKVLRGFAIFFLLLGALYLVGPRVETPELNESPVSVPSDLMSLERWITEKENALGNVRSGNASQIIFNDSVPKKTKFSVLYLHGFTASGREGEPVHRDIAKAIGANLYIPRLYGHGLEETEPMLGFNNEDFWESGKEALAVAKQLGEKVIVLGTSHGGALSLSLATDPDIAALCLFGP